MIYLSFQVDSHSPDLVILIHPTQNYHPTRDREKAYYKYKGENQHQM